jgi:hypothetical protein
MAPPAAAHPQRWLAKGWIKPPLGVAPALRVSQFAT